MLTSCSVAEAPSPCRSPAGPTGAPEWYRKVTYKLTRRSWVLARGDSNTRQHILDIAVGIIAESGSSDLRVVDVAKRASVGVPTIYYHFESRSQLIAEAQVLAYLKVIEPLHGLLEAAEAAIVAGDQAAYEAAVGANMVLAWKSGQPGDRWAVVKLLLDVWAHTATQVRFCEMLDQQFLRWIDAVNQAKQLGWIDPSIDGRTLIALFWSASIGQVITSSSASIDPSPEGVRDFFLNAARNSTTDAAPLSAGG